MKIKSNLKKIIAALSLTLMFSVNAFALIQHMVWNKIPIQIELPLNKEKLISFPGAIQPYLPSDLLNDGALKSINNNGVLYLTASKAFKNHMTEIKSLKTGKIILLEISANKSANDNQINIVFHRKLKNTPQGTNNANEDESLGSLVRWVAQELYAPKRLLTEPSWIFRTAMHTRKFVPLYMGGAITSMPLASWHVNGYYITAVLMRNAQLHQPIILSHTMLRGNWIAVSFFRLSNITPSVLTPDRTKMDTTTAILVSSVPFSQALEEGYNDA